MRGLSDDYISLFCVYRFISGCVVEFRGQNSILVGVNVTPGDFYSPLYTVLDPCFGIIPFWI